jgi:glycerophosphoryl diester phosphodiesterase
MKFTLFLLFALSMTTLSSGQMKDTGIYLTGYTIPQEKEVIGFVKSKTSTIKSITLGGEFANAFSISKDQLITVKRKKLSASRDWYDVVLHIETEKGKTTETVRLLKDHFIRNKVIAHRGAWKNTGATENSIAALQHAVRLGCTGSEFDVHMSSDSLPVIHHDAAIDGVSIAKTNADVLLKMKLSNGEFLPTLENYIREGMKQNTTKLVLEIKPSELGKESSIALTHKIVALVHQLHAQAWIDYISFDYDVCLEVMKLAPYAKVAYLRGEKTPDELAADHFFGSDYHFSFYEKNPGWINESHQKGLTINVWTVNEKPLMEKLLQQHVDFITTNEPELLLTLPGAK